MIRLKSSQDLFYIKEAIKIGESILDIAAKFLYPGQTTLTIDKILNDLIEQNGAKSSFYLYKGFPGHICISVNEEIIHGVPGDKILKDGDIVKIDIGINYNGYFSDQARPYSVGKLIEPKYHELIWVCRNALEKACSLATKGNNLIEVSKSIEETAKNYGFGILRDFGGHGVGFEIHEEPLIPNCAPYVDLELKSGMVFAIETMFVLGKGNYTIEKNGWTILADGMAAHEEKTVIIG